MRRNWQQSLWTKWHVRIASAGLACLISSAVPAYAWQFRDITPTPDTGEEATNEENGTEGDESGDEVAEDPPAIVEVDEHGEPTPATRDGDESPLEPVPLSEESVAADGPLEDDENNSDDDLKASPAKKSATKSTDESLEVEPNPHPADAAEVGEALAAQSESRMETSEPAIRPIRFSQITVGESTDEQLTEHWGEPFKITRGTDYDIHKYRMRPFRQVDVTVVDHKIQSILIHLDEPLDPKHCEEQLGLSKLNSVPIPDEFGKVLGLCFPERGTLFSFDSDDPDTLVTKISIEPITAEPFVLRALYDFSYQFERNLADLEQAIGMENRDAQSHWLKASKLEMIGRYRDAVEAANQAVSMDGENPLYRLTRARLLALNGDHDMSQREVERVLAMAELPTELRAQGELQLGDLIANGQRPRYKEAMEHHLAAIDLAASLASDRRFVPRRMAKEILVHAHLAVAHNIAAGDYQRQTEVAPKWLSRARALVEELVGRDQGDQALRLVVYREILSTAADLQNVDDPSGVVDEMFQEGRRLIAATKDPLNQSRIEWLLGEGAAEAVRLQRLRGENDSALRHADDALVLLQQAAKKRQSSPEQRFLVGRLYFHTGSLHAIHRQDHSEAITWYEKAHPLMSNDVPMSALAQPRMYGEAFISMGVSYWKQGDRQRAIDLTEQGADVLQQAVVDGLLSAESLAIPYGNLASMHKQAGNATDAKAFAEMAASVKTGKTIKR